MSKKFDYIINAGTTLDALRPACAFKTKDKAITGALRMAEAGTRLKYFEVVYMPEDDIDTNEVVWANFER